jgi:hypothetical protein
MACREGIARPGRETSPRCQGGRQGGKGIAKAGVKSPQGGEPESIVGLQRFALRSVV